MREHLARHVRGLGTADRTRRIEFAHQAPAYRRAYQNAFGCTVHFAAGGNRLYYDRGLLSMPLKTADPRLFEALEFYLGDLLKVRTQDDDVLPKLNHLIGTSLHAGTPTIADLAARLGMSSVTRAFKRWTSLSPDQMRAGTGQHRRGGTS